MVSNFKAFEGIIDRYNGITIDTETESINSFAERLRCM